MNILRRRTKHILYLSLYLFPLALMAQTGSVNLTCFSNNILNWENQDSPCTFLQHEIFFSSNIDGPYSGAVLITDQDQESFNFPALPPGEVFFYIETSSECPGLMTVISDTISTFPPALVSISYLDVLETGVNIVWEDEINPLEDHAYVIYRNIGSETDAIDTVYNVYEYLDTAISPLTEVETYYVLALNDCGSLSIFDTPLSTVFLSASYMYCEGSFLLDWNHMERWDAEVESVSLHVEYETGQDTIIAVDKELVNLDVTTFFGEGEYCFELIMDLDSGEQFSSNKICEYIILPPVLDLYRFTNIDQDGGALLIDWEWMDESAIVEYSLSSYTGSGEQVWSSGGQAFSSGDVSSFTDLSSIASGDQYLEYQLSITDVCDSVYLSSLFSNVFLELEKMGSSVEFTWSYLEIEYMDSEELLIYKVDNVNGDKLLGSFAALDGSAVLNLSEADVKSGLVEYYAVRRSLILNENGVDLPINSRSNIVQLFNEVELIFPNAIRPSGVNTIFKPVLISGEIQSYECIIYDRYGKELFRTENIDDGWTGQLGLDYLPAQVYSFVAQVVDSAGKIYTYNGNVTIVK